MLASLSETLSEILPTLSQRVSRGVLQGPGFVMN